MITLKDINKTYQTQSADRVIALNKINLTINEGEIIILKGSSGSGKSTVLSLVAGLTKPTTGEVIVDEQRISKLPDNFSALFRRESIGFIFQKYNLIPTLSVKENILLPLVPTNPDELEAEEKLQRVMEQFNIAHKSDSIVRNLSGGEQQRVAIARAYINDPKIIIADEPTANLDEKLSLHFIEMLREMKSSNKTIIIATHDPLFFDLDFTDRIVELYSGEIVNA